MIKLISFSLVLLLTLTLICGELTALYLSENEEPIFLNFSAGYLDIKIVEEPTNLELNNTNKKLKWGIENVGSKDVYLRAILTETIIGESIEIQKYYNEEEWILQKDGYYYFKRPFLAGETVHLIIDLVNDGNIINVNKIIYTLKVDALQHSLNSASYKNWNIPDVETARIIK
jgi:hypothetical protein